MTPEAEYFVRAEAGHADLAAGRFASALRLYQRALHLATSHDALADRRARMQHNMVGVCAMMGRSESAEHHFRAALRLYGTDHPMVPALLNDRAALHLMHGAPLAAASLLEPLLDRISDIPREGAEIRLRANLALAWSHAGRSVAARTAAARLRSLLETTNAAAPWAWACLARVASAAGDAPEIVRRYARQANRARSVHPDANAAALLDSIRG